MSQQSQQSWSSQQPWSSQQHPIGSPFGAAATAAEVLEGADLRGRSVVVTGGHQGIGFEVTRALAGAGAEVLVGARSPERAAGKVAGIAGVEVDRLDLVDPGSVDAFVGRRLAAGRPVDVLVNCAAIAPPAERTLDADGHEIQFATSHLGPFRLTLGLLPLLRAARGARVVNVSSGAQRMGASPLGRPRLHDRLPPRCRLRAGQAGRRALRRRAGPALGRRGRAGVRRAPGRRDRDESQQPSRGPGGVPGAGAPGRGGQARHRSRGREEDARVRGRPPSSSPPRARCSTGSEACT